MFSDWERRILSKPMPVRWAGFESNTFRLQQAGWEFTAEQCFERMATRLMMRHKQFGMYGCTDTVDTDFFASQHSDHWQAVYFPVQWMTGGTCQVMRITDNFSAMQPVDMQPSFVDTEKWESIEECVMFGAPLVRTNEIIVDPDDVAAMMERILTLQKPGAQAHYEEKLREMQRPGQLVKDLRPQQNFHAQVISLVS